MNAFPNSKNVQDFHVSRLEPGEQLYPLAELQITTRIHVIKFGTNSNLNFSMNFKEVYTLWEKSSNSLKIYLELIFIKVNLAGHTCMQ
jgi:hypothetical protein